MGVHSVFVVSQISKSLLYSRYFESEELLSCVNKHDFEKYLLLHTNRYWVNLDAGDDRFCICLDGTIVVLVLGVGNVLVYVNGTKEMDEATLPEPGEALRDLILELVSQQYGIWDIAKINESHLVENSDLYTKFAMCVDEMIPFGVVEQLDPKELIRLIKMKE